MKRKNRVIATILGFFGPLGTLYFGWRVMLLNFLSFFMVTLITIFATSDTPPSWYQYVTAAFFMAWSYFFTDVHNGIAEDGRDEAEILGFVFNSALAYLTIYCMLVGIGRSLELFSDGHYVKAALGVFIGIPFTIYLSNMCLAFVLAAVAGLMQVGNRRRA